MNTDYTNYPKFTGEERIGAGMPGILLPASARAGNTSAPSIAVIGSGEMSVVLQTAGYTPLPDVSMLTVATFCQRTIKRPDLPA